MSVIALLDAPYIVGEVDGQSGKRESMHQAKTSDRGAGRVRAGVAPRWQGMGPVVLSAVVFPGVGQFVQRRWVAGAVWVIVFGAAFVWLLARCFAVLKAYYDLAFDFNHADGGAPSAAAIVAPFLVSMVVYVANLVDTAMAGRRSPAVPPLP